MTKEFDSLKREILILSNKKVIHDSQEEKRQQIESTNREDEKTKKYRENLERLKSVGIIDIFEEIIRNRVVVLSPEKRFQEWKENRSFFTGRSGKYVEVIIPERPAYMTISKFSSSWPDQASVHLYFDAYYDQNFDENRDCGSGCYERSIYANCKGNGQLEIGSKTVPLDISRGDLITEVNQAILVAKGLVKFQEK